MIDAITRSAMWKDSVISLRGTTTAAFYDHVPPPDVDRMGFGLRVPLVVISPHAVDGTVSHEEGESPA